ncbi:hypothetical protein [Candidatus Palauibacter irciniicola]|uniref:hypothetical protein n=1 Tax=Candidatus Palauibacter irciniicola TaxID=3056733 RepID=UPI003B015569
MSTGNLSHSTIAVSISESPDMGTYGLSLGHLREALADFAIHLLASGDDLAYGGDLRAHGFTELLFDLVARYRRPAEVNVRPPVTNYLAWPVHISMTAASLFGFEAHLRGSAKLTLLARDGSRLTMEERQSLKRHAPSESEWAEGLTRMREVMRAESDARVVLGGRVEGYKGRMPGIAEEALLSLQSGQAVFLVGGFGGCTRDIAETLRLVEPRAGSDPGWPGRQAFERWGVRDLHNGLSDKENRLLAHTPYVQDAVDLVLRGIGRLRDDPAHKQHTEILHETEEGPPIR